MYKASKGYSKSFIKPSSPIDALSTPNANKPSSFVSNTHTLKFHKPSFDLSGRQGITVAEFTTQPTPTYSAKAASKIQNSSKSPLTTKPKGKDFTTNNKDVIHKEFLKKQTYALVPKKKDGQTHDSSQAQLFEPFPPTKHSKRWSDYGGNSNYQIENQRGTVAERMTPDRCSRTDVTLEECRSTFSTLETQETLENEVLKQDKSTATKRKAATKVSTASSRFSLKNQNDSQKLLQEEFNQKKFVNGDLAWETKQNTYVKHKRESLPLEKVRLSSEETLSRNQQKSSLELKDSKLFCINHTNKKAKYIQVEPKTPKQGEKPKFFCSDCAVEAASNDVSVMKLQNPSSRVVTEESMINQFSIEDEIQRRTVTDPQECRNEDFSIQINRNKREQNVKNFLQKTHGILSKISSLESQQAKDRDHLQTNFQVISEKVNLFTTKIINNLKEQTNVMLTNLKTEYSKEITEQNKFSEHLERAKKGLLEMNTDIEKNYKNILNHIEENPYKEIMGKYNEELQTIEYQLGNATNLSKNIMKFLPSEKLSYFKRRLKTAVNESFSDSHSEANLTYNGSSFKERKHEKRDLPKMNTIGDFEDFLKSEENEEVLTAKQNPSAHVVVSFNNKDIFQNALKTSFKENEDPNYLQEEEFEQDCIKEVPSLETSFLSTRTDKVQSQTLSGASSLNKYVNLLDKVNQKKDSRTHYLKLGSLYEMGRKASHVYDHAHFIDFIENKLKDESIRETCQKSLFQSPSFKTSQENALIF